MASAFVVPDSHRIVGARITLISPLPKSSDAALCKVMNCKQTMKYLMHMIPEGGFTETMMAQRREKQCQEQCIDATRFQFVVEQNGHKNDNDDDDARFIGVAGLYRLDCERRRGEFGIILSDSCSGHGVGSEVMLLVLREAFDGLNLNECLGVTNVDNVPMRRCFERFGWSESRTFTDDGDVKLVEYALGKDSWPQCQALLNERVSK
jgi:RimJ/RimL family protein N-acetyltransferase